MLNILEIRSELHPNGIFKRIRSVDIFCNNCNRFVKYHWLPGSLLHTQKSFIRFACCLCKNESIRFLPEHFTWHDVTRNLKEEVII